MDEKGWTRRRLDGKQYAYWWVDGIYITLRESDDSKLCLLVIIGATPMAPRPDHEHPMPFQLFGTAHLLALSVIAALALGLPLLLRRRAPGLVAPVAWLLGALLLAQEVAQAAWLWRSLGPGLHLLPLDLCTLSVFFTAWVLITRSPRIYEIVYFWGLGGTTQALITPELFQGFPSAEFIFFFAGHGLVVIGVVYATLALQLRPYPRSILRVAAMTLALAAAVFLLNLLLGTNFMYLMAKPMQPSLLDWFGPWPWYLAGLFATALLTFVVLYLPWLVVDFRRSHRTPLSKN